MSVGLAAHPAAAQRTLPAVDTAGGLQVSLPVACTRTTGCVIQNYVDVDQGPGARDFTCRQATYDGHKGTDFRVSATGKDAGAVLAAAPGVVRGVRDVMASRILGKSDSRKHLAGRECGNGVVIAHPGGWETQYCHLARGIQVKPGDQVRRGQVLGRIGASGLAQFAHLHLSIRKNGKVIDPFTGTAPAKAACPRAGEPVAIKSALWTPRAAAKLGAPQTRVLDAGFVSAPPSLAGLERGIDQRKRVDPKSGALVYYARVMHVRKGDRLVMALRSPDRSPMKSAGEPLDKFKATFVRFIGRRRPAQGWPKGEFRAELAVVRDGAVIARRQSRITVRP